MSTTANGKDLEVIVDLLVIAAIFLSPKADSTFTFDQLLNEANGMDKNITLEKDDVNIVLNHMGLKTIKKLGKDKYCLR